MLEAKGILEKTEICTFSHPTYPIPTCSIPGLACVLPLERDIQVARRNVYVKITAPFFSGSWKTE
ncbi:hypothetical protein BCY86_02180 [Pajaroellobacter abortibovis]|uniref:Uncharacterized protein n=1 Tax=Pajaroellobacter abortibovis TaxID=1882918 RepID=A0A1L6MW05_9BACT|nr:hypothetical protein BCY86_02180 [Pajaroellobacter abortibovis]